MCEFVVDHEVRNHLGTTSLKRLAEAPPQYVFKICNVPNGVEFLIGKALVEQHLHRRIFSLAAEKPWPTPATVFWTLWSGTSATKSHWKNWMEGSIRRSRGAREKANEARPALKLEDLKPPERLPSAINPCPIQEAVIEVRYERPKGMIWDAVPGIVFGRLQDKGWDTLERLPIAEVPQEILEMEANLQHAPHYSLNKGPCLLLLGPKMLGQANKSPYLGWKDLFAEFRTIFENLAPF